MYTEPTAIAESGTVPIVSNDRFALLAKWHIGAFGRMLHEIRQGESFDELTFGGGRALHRHRAHDARQPQNRESGQVRPVHDKGRLRVGDLLPARPNPLSTASPISHPADGWKRARTW